MSKGWIFVPYTKDELVFRLCSTETHYTHINETIAVVETPGALWRVVSTFIRVNGFFVGKKAGESVLTIVCDLIRRDEDTGELYYRSMTESESPTSQSCPLHFLDMVPETRSARWRQFVRQYHGQDNRGRKPTRQVVAKVA